MNEITIEKLLNEIIKNREEIKSAIETTEAHLLLKVEQDRNKINQLEQENNILRQEVESLKQANRKNNVIIFGIKHQVNEINVDFIQQKIKSLLQIELVKVDINDVYTLGKSEDSPIKIQFTSYLTKKHILQNCKKLKDTNIFIGHDLTEKQREENKLLRKHLYIAKKDQNKTCYIKNNKLHINGTAITVEELKELDKQELDKESESGTTPSYQDERKTAPEADNPKTRKMNEKKKRIR